MVGNGFYTQRATKHCVNPTTNSASLKLRLEERKTIACSPQKHDCNR